MTQSTAKTRRISRLVPAVSVLTLIIGSWIAAQSQPGAAVDQVRRQRFIHQGDVADEGLPALPNGQIRGGDKNAPAEAPTGFDNLTNGFSEQGPPFASLDEDSVMALRSFNDNRFIFEEVETVEDGLGPTYNAQSCRECHQNVVTGGASQVTEHRTGRLENGQFFESPGGSLIQSRATYPEMAEHVAVQDDIRTFRISTNTLGSGFVEAIANSTLLGIRDRQPDSMRGTALVVSVFEANSQARIGRFGWKSQHASLESFAADAYLNEMGITSPLLPVENTSSGRDVAPYDPVADPENDGKDVLAFANFMRATKAPPRGPITPDVLTGEALFTRVGCATCHVASITTAQEGMPINGGAFIVPAALARKIIHPYSDFLLHDIGTGDGIPVLPTTELASTATQIRTAPLWALRTRNRLMHDGLSFTKEEAIHRHAGQAAGVKSAFEALPAAQRAAVMAFLDSL
jgi:CxxC motif-containing protein (DUF1111 family)